MRPLLQRHRKYNNLTSAETMASGGTERIAMAIEAYCDWARAAKGTAEPETPVYDSGWYCGHFISFSGLFPHPPTQRLIKERRT